MLQANHACFGPPALTQRCPCRHYPLPPPPLCCCHQRHCSGTFTSTQPSRPALARRPRPRRPPPPPCPSLPPAAPTPCSACAAGGATSPTLPSLQRWQGRGQANRGECKGVGASGQERLQECGRGPLQALAAGSQLSAAAAAAPAAAAPEPAQQRAPAPVTAVRALFSGSLRASTSLKERRMSLALSSCSSASAGFTGEQVDSEQDELGVQQLLLRPCRFHRGAS